MIDLRDSLSGRDQRWLRHGGRPVATRPSATPSATLDYGRSDGSRNLTPPNLTAAVTSWVPDARVPDEYES